MFVILFRIMYLAQITTLIESVSEVFLPTLLFWFFGDFRDGVFLFIVILVKYKNR